MGRTVVFVCAHGAARSRLAAAWFNADAPPGWHAITAAGEDPATSVHPHVGPLLAGIPATPTWTTAHPGPMATAGTGDVVIAIDCTVPGAHRWNLHATEVDDAMRDELRDLVTTLTQTLHTGADQNPHDHRPGKADRHRRALATAVKAVIADAAGCPYRGAHPARPVTGEAVIAAAGWADPRHGAERGRAGSKPTADTTQGRRAPGPCDAPGPNVPGGQDLAQ
jgi:hypothetical protein